MTLSRVRSLAETGEARRRRVEARLSVTEAARTLDVAPATLSRWEHGQRRPRGALALRYAQFLNELSELGDE